MITCRSCQHANPSEYSFCEDCGSELPSIKCPSCLHYNPKEYSFCEECGQSLTGLVCLQCQHLNPENVRFCKACGSPIQVPQEAQPPPLTAAAATSPPAQPAMAASLEQRVAAQPAYYQAQRPSKIRQIVVRLLISTVIGYAGGLIWQFIF